MLLVVVLGHTPHGKSHDLTWSLGVCRERGDLFLLLWFRRLEGKGEGRGGEGRGGEGRGGVEGRKGVVSILPGPVKTCCYNSENANAKKARSHSAPCLGYQ